MVALTSHLMHGFLVLYQETIPFIDTGDELMSAIINWTVTAVLMWAFVWLGIALVFQVLKRS